MEYFYKNIPFGSFSWNYGGPAVAFRQPGAPKNPLSPIRIARARFHKGQTNLYRIPWDWDVVVNDILITSISKTYAIHPPNEILENVLIAFVTEIIHAYEDLQGNIIGYKNVRIPVDYISSADLIEKNLHKRKIVVDK